MPRPSKFMYPDVISVVRQDGTRADNITAQIGTKILTYDDVEPIEDGDEIQRVRGDGRIDRFRVLDNGYTSKISQFQAHYSIKYEKINDLPRKENPTSIVYNLNGENSRVNNQSHDQSINVVNASSPELFEELRAAIAHGVKVEAERDELLAVVHDLEKDQDKPGFAEHFKRFIMIGGAYMSLIGPFLPALAQMGGAG